MSLEYYDPTLRKLQVLKPADVHIVHVPMEPGPTVDQTQAIDDVFAKAEERNPIADALWLGSAGLLLHDIVSDTLKPGKEEEEKQADDNPGNRPGKDD